MLYSKEQGVRLSLGVSDMIWTTYNFSNCLWVQGVNSLIGVVFSIVSIVFYRVKSIEI